ncbi:MAG: tRNA threonylcarbamoyladenosine dehydratase [Oscillospiraceae bacterium]|nr:tRNA threonylcarbamoyladenosine dehydratase [Oscillospiraceae bacterium]
MSGRFSRTESLIGADAMERLKNACVAVFGVGGVGSYIAEGLARCGVGRLDLIDSDDVDVTNLNRQLEALENTVGTPKAQAMKERILLINPECEVIVHDCFFLPENSDSFDFTQYDYIADAVDTVTAKIELVLKAQRENVPIISSMGTGNKLSPAMLEVSDIYKTSVCPLARVMRQELKKRGVKKLKVVYSKEEPIKARAAEGETHGRNIPASAVFVPGAAGLIIASEIVKELVRSCL